MTELATANTQIPELPHSIEAEQAVLGALMLANDAFDSVASLITEEDFYGQDHRLIFETMKELADKDQPLDPITLSEALKSLHLLEEAGGDSYLVNIARNTPSSENIRAYAQIILERSIVRKLILAASEIAQKGYNPLGWDSGKLLAEAERRLLEVVEGRPKEGGFQNVTDLLRQAVDRIEQLFTSDGDITGLSTGFDELNASTSGWQLADLVIIAGRPSMGKTSFAMNLVEHAMLNQDKPVLVFSLEMPANQLVIRLLSSMGKIDQTKMRNGNLDPDDFTRLAGAAARLKDRPLFIDDTPGISPMELRNRIRQLSREHGSPALIMIDYLQLMSASTKADGRVQEISQISRDLKIIAREFDCPILALSQLSRNLEQRPNKRPINSDLRDSGAIEQDADVIIFIYRDEVYNEESQDKGIAEIIIGKQRNGPIGTSKLAFVGKYTRFENLARDYFSED